MVDIFFHRVQGEIGDLLIPIYWGYLFGSWKLFSKRRDFGTMFKTLGVHNREFKGKCATFFGGTFENFWKNHLLFKCILGAWGQGFKGEIKLLLCLLCQWTRGV